MKVLSADVLLDIKRFYAMPYVWHWQEPNRKANVLFLEKKDCFYKFYLLRRELTDEIIKSGCFFHYCR